MRSRSVLLLLVSTSGACLVAAVASCNGETASRVDGPVASDRPASTEPISSGGSGGVASSSEGAVGGTGGGAGSGGSGGQARTGGAGGVRASSSARGGGAGTRGPDAGSAVAGSSGRVVDAAADADASPGGEVSPLACSDRTSNGRLGVYYYTGSPAAQTQDVQIHLDLINFTALTARLSQATVRYWFTDEDAGTPNILTVYYTPPAVGKINARFLPVTPPRTGADTVLEFSFTPNPDAGASFVETTEFNFAFHKDGYGGTYDQSNDYSFDASLAKTLAANPKITAYIAGELAWGCEPPLAVDSGRD